MKIQYIFSLVFFFLSVLSCTNPHAAREPKTEVGMVLDDVCMAALEAHFANESSGEEINIMDVSPKVLQWLRARYPEHRFIPKGMPFGITGAPVVRTDISAAFDAGKQRCRVVIDSVMGPVGATTFEYTLKRDKKGNWRVVTRTMGPLA